MTKTKIEIRECVTPDELSGCVRLQREVFAMPEVEISPVRHFIVTRHAGGFTLGAFYDGQLVGFVLSVLAYKGNEKIFYSHMTAVDKNFQNLGIGTKLKWSQRERALKENVDYIKWTFQPVKARNAYFNLEKLGAVVREYHPNFYGTDYGAFPDEENTIGIESDRLFAEWELNSERVRKLAVGESDTHIGDFVLRIRTLNDWQETARSDPKKAIAEQTRIKADFENAFSNNLVCRGFERDDETPNFLLFSR
ncbi:MAG: GNAT family N-acetyltransferase [Pyrinomonadaceae bacterium]|nr:GNAT family N-acetyltransferase [Pyrinomonadaceae bacterium]